MKHIKEFEKIFLKSDYNPDKPFESELINGAFHNDIQRIENALNSGENINYQKNGDYITALMMAAYYQHYDVIDYLIKKGADWNIKDVSGEDFVDMMNDFGMRDYLKVNYPKKYKEYLIKKDSEKYNL